MKNSINILVPLLLVTSICFAQTTKKVETYHDPYEKTSVYEVYTVLNTPPYEKHGNYKAYNTNKVLMADYNYLNGKKHGTCIDYGGKEMNTKSDKFYLDKPLLISNYKNGVYHGDVIKYVYWNGQQIAAYKSSYIDGNTILTEERDYQNKLTKSLRLNGLNFSTFPNGQREKEYTLKNGEYEGKYVEYYENGQISVATNYSNGNLSGKHIEYFPDGTIQMDATYQNGKLVGEIVANWTNGKPRRKTKFSSAYEELSTQEFSQDGILKLNREKSGNLYLQITYDSIKGYKIFEEQLTFDSNSNDFIRNGKLVAYNEQGKKIIENNFKNGVGDGEYSQWDSEGNLITNGFAANGTRVGKWKFHYDADWNQVSEKSQATYFREIDYSKPGYWTTIDYYISGEKQFEGVLSSENPDVIEGKAKFYHKTGKLFEEVTYIQGYKSGNSTIYNENGIMTMKLNYYIDSTKGRAIKVEEYYPSGVIRAKGLMTIDEQRFGIWQYFDESGKENSREDFRY